MILLIAHHNDKVEHRSYFEGDTIYYSKHDKEGISITAERNKIPVANIVINGDEERHVYLMNDGGKTIDHFYWKVNS